MNDAPSVRAAILAWYDRNRRDLPWRARPGALADPYAVWLSEIMLQQTTVAAVGRYFRAFIERWPNVGALAAASDDDVMREWAGLGYYARARNLVACARLVAEEFAGRFPDTEEGLRDLPGIGAYTAAAIVAIAFDRRATVVDGNVERVIARLFAVTDPLPESKKQLRQLAGTFEDDERPGDFAQAMMDLGATVCTPRRPDCGRCPVAGACLAHARGIEASLPTRSAKADRPVRHGIAFWAERADGAVLLRRRPARGLLGGMTELPSTEWTGGPTSAEAALDAAPVHGAWEPAGRIEHTFTHFHLTLDLWRADAGVNPGVRACAAPERCFWVDAGRIGEEALPSVMRKLAGLVIGPRARR